MNAMKQELTIGSRGSDLALCQSKMVRDALNRELGVESDVKIIKTAGDKFDKLSFDKMEGKGFFTKELEDALLIGEIDLAVHSLKDMMTTQPQGLKLGAVGFRSDRRELLLIAPEAQTDNGVLPVKPGRTIGTSSERRKSQIAYHNPELVIRDLRGNVPTRVNKLREGEYDAMVIAAAGVERLKLDLSDITAIYLDPLDFLSAPAQGILGLQIRSDDPETESVVSELGDEKATVAASLERGLLARFDTGCSLPLGVLSRIEGGAMHLKAVLGQKKDDAWSGLREAEVSGTDVELLVEEAYKQLTGID